MNEEKLQSLLSALPEEFEIAERAARARGRALARLDDARPVRHVWRWATCLAALPVLLAGIWLVQLSRVQPLPWTPPAPQIAAPDLRAPVAVAAGQPVRRRPHRPALAQQRLEVQWQLSDGTRVQWTFSEDFSL